MDKKETLQWVDEIFTNAQNQNYTGKIRMEIDFSQGGANHCEVGFSGKPIEVRKNI